ncbi:hypothetical protein BS47DRAFT_1363457 [Hydnum rufescens UP504]|uniref:NACHT domain-containing protein n=1 Tax=Hydnum rufescens UP504 TaxID=1448309 RepID=A0A9P6AU11_9AGAM|nr:hypothetical protein BS47DRAFT_1363457 [Hydnum rufescens UP504]
MKRPFKPGKTARGVSLAILQPLRHLLDAIPVPGAKDVISILLDVVEGFDAASIRDLERISSSVEAKSSAGILNQTLLGGQESLFRGNNTSTLEYSFADLLRAGFTERSAAVMSLPRADSAAYDSGREDAPLSCFEGTRVSILAEIMSWFESTENGTPPIYWLVGLAGIGKSTIAKTVAERADKRPDEDRMLGGSFFFSRSDAPLRNPNLVFPTLAFQLAQADNEFKNIIGEAVQQDATLGNKKPLAQFEGLILKPLSELDSHRRTTLIVLDALDECDERGAATILQLLLAHASQLPFLRILITSRPEPHISLVFSDARNLAKRILHDVEASVIEEDLRLYIRSELSEIPKKLGLRTIGDWTDGEINALVEKSGKLFIYAATSIRFIGDDRVRDPRGHLRLILDTQLSKESEATPYSQLDSLYVGVLRNSLSNSDNRKAIVKWFQTVVGSIVLLRQPLPLGSLARFVQCTLDNVDTALRRLRSVIIPPSTPDEAPRIYHPSFRDFITDPSRCSIPECPASSHDHTLRLWDAMSGVHIATLPGNSTWVASVAFSPNGSWLASGSHDNNNLHLWDAMSGKQIRTLRGHSEWVTSVVFSPDSLWLASGLYDHTICLWDVMLCTPIMILQVHPHWVTSVAFSPDGLWLASGFHDNTMCLWDAMSGGCIATLQGHSEWVTSVAFSPNGTQLVSGSRDSTLHLWDGMSGAQIASFQGHSDWVVSVAFSPDGLWLVSGCQDSTMRLWDAVSGMQSPSLQGHFNSVTLVAFSPDGSNDHTIWLWIAMSGTHIATLQGHSDSVALVAFSPDGLWLVSGSNDRTYACGIPCQASTLQDLSAILLAFKQFHFPWMVTPSSLKGSVHPCGPEWTTGSRQWIPMAIILPISVISLCIIHSALQSTGQVYPINSDFTHSQSRVHTLRTAVGDYANAVHKDSQFFDLVQIEDLPSQSRLRNDPVLIQNLTQLDTEIEVVEKIEHDLQRAKNRLRQRRARTRNVLTPISFLPNEILGHIFTCDPPVGRELTEFTESITRVCQHWRAVAIQHSSLWTAIDLRWHAFRQATWASRAGDRLLSAILEFPALPGMLDHETWDGFNVMANHPYWRRWCSLDLYLTEETQAYVILDWLSNMSEACGTTGLPNLTSLNLIKQGNPDAERGLFPNLRSLTTYHVYFKRILDFMPALVTLKTNTVGAHSSDTGAVTRWLQIFRTCTRLEDLEADWNRAGWTLHRPSEMPPIVDPPTPGDHTTDIIIVPHLHTLRLRWVDWRVCRQLLRRLHFSALQFLSVEMDPFIDCTAAFGGTDYFETAEFKGYGAFIALLLRGMTDGSRSSRSSSSSSSPTMLLPNLAHLVLDTFDDGDFSAYGNELLCFLRPRVHLRKKILGSGTAGAVHALRSLRLRHSRCTEKERLFLMKKIGIVLVDDLSEDDAMDDSPNFEGISGDGDDNKDGGLRWNPDMNDTGAPEDSEDDWIYSEDSSCTDEDIIRQESEDSDDSGGNTDDDLPPYWAVEDDLGLNGHFHMWAGGVEITPFGSSDDSSDSDGSL